MATFEHERLDAYKVSIEFVAIADTVAGDQPKGRAYLADQLRRAASSVCLNIAEGAGEFAFADKARFYRMARRSATESAAVLDVCRALSLIDDRRVAPGRDCLLRVVAMLTAAVVRRRESGSGSGSGSD